ncbi:hypothetical protein ACFP1Z_17700 [Streptomyces gamaensis]|uniref:Uncharacterized protein n=1 Tax=Streptomyces gamaensis TaxID=1763542 RepID=A0ABW0Z628_9ACTN
MAEIFKTVQARSIRAKCSRALLVPTVATLALSSVAISAAPAAASPVGRPTLWEFSDDPFSTAHQMEVILYNNTPDEIHHRWTSDVQGEFLQEPPKKIKPGEGKSFIIKNTAHRNIPPLGGGGAGARFQYSGRTGAVDFSVYTPGSFLYRNQYKVYKGNGHGINPPAVTGLDSTGRRWEIPAGIADQERNGSQWGGGGTPRIAFQFGGGDMELGTKPAMPKRDVCERIVGDMGSFLSSARGDRDSIGAAMGGALGAAIVGGIRGCFSGDKFKDQRDELKRELEKERARKATERAKEIVRGRIKEVSSDLERIEGRKRDLTEMESRNVAKIAARIAEISAQINATPRKEKDKRRELMDRKFELGKELIVARHDAPRLAELKKQVSEDEGRVEQLQRRVAALNKQLEAL